MASLYNSRYAWEERHTLSVHFLLLLKKRNRRFKWIEANRITRSNHLDPNIFAILHVVNASWFKRINQSYSFKRVLMLLQFDNSKPGSDLISQFGTFGPRLRQGYPLNLSISLSGGKETNKDSPSNGEWSGKSSSLKPVPLWKGIGL